MKTTYLVNVRQPDGTDRLSVVSRDEWRKIVATNRRRPAGKRRYFIVDQIVDNGMLDCMVIETSEQEYQKWNRERMAAKRNREAGRKFQVLSLEAPVQYRASDITLRDIIQSDIDVEEELIEKLLLEKLQKELATWKPWGIELLNMYLSGQQRNCTVDLTQKYNISPQTARKYKRQFEKFLIKFFEGVSF